MNNSNSKYKFEEIAEFGNIGNVLAEFFKDAPNNRDVIKVYKIARQQAKEGVTRNIKTLIADVCEVCNGTGKKDDTVCENCQGRRFVYNEKNVEIKIPPKTKNNDYIILEGKGNKFSINQKRGDLVIKIHIYGNKSRRRGKKIYE